jgi:DNA-directed RNA polymerase specialized sigma24 family protein
MTDAVRPALPAQALAFDALLRPPEYRRLRGRLIRIFARRGCSIPEDLADETISRVLGRLPEIADSYVGDPLLFILAVARNVQREYSRRPRTVPWDERDRPPESPENEVWVRERTSACLESCLSKLDAADERLIREYYRYDGSAKNDRRRILAEEMGIALNTLWVKAFRIRQRLAGCVFDCSKNNAANLK